MILNYTTETPEERNILELFITNDSNNIELAKMFAESQEINLKGLLTKHFNIDSLLYLLCSLEDNNILLADEVIKILNIDIEKVLKSFNIFNELSIANIRNFLEASTLCDMYPHNKNVIRIKINSTDYSTDSLKGVKYFKNTKCLDLYRCSYKSLNYIEDLKTSLVTCLLCKCPNLTSLEELKDFEVLKFIYLSKTNISDLSPLYFLPNLERLELFNNPIIQEEVDNFKKYQPNCVVKYSNQQ